MAKANNGKKVVYVKETGREVHHFDASTHTILLDLNKMRQSAIGDAITLFAKHATPAGYGKDEHLNQLIGMAIGYFQVPLEMFYPDIKDMYELNDSALAWIVRWSKIREANTEEKKSE